nr:inositol polyphosphate 1-phosphatase-like [Lytechinus pictus]
MSELLRMLVLLGEKAGNLARIIRAEKALFELLVEEKTGEAKNKRFIQDFKTLGDVLIQEMIRHDVGEKFPGIRDHIFGEESNMFTNTAGESVEVSIQPTPEETKSLLTRVLDENQKAAALLAEALHATLDTKLDSALLDLTFDLDVEKMGIWIDPIDSTSEYIKGIEDAEPENGVYHCGLQCAVILIGAFHRETGSPVLGVVNQPFARQDPETKSWTGQTFWGVSHGDIQCNSITSSQVSLNTPTTRNGIAFVMSSSEDAQTKDTLSSLGRVHFASGAGYKILCVIEGHVDAYILTKGSTFKWDTCGPQAILKSFGGGIVNIRRWKSLSNDAENRNFLASASLEYHKPDPEVRDSLGEKWSNSGGIIAYRNPDVLEKIHGALQI